MLLYLNQQKLKSMSDEDFVALVQFWKDHSSNEDTFNTNNAKSLEGIRIWHDLNIKFIDKETGEEIVTTSMYDYMTHTPVNDIDTSQWCIGSITKFVYESELFSQYNISPEALDGTLVFSEDFIKRMKPTEIEEVTDSKTGLVYEHAIWPNQQDRTYGFYPEILDSATYNNYKDCGCEFYIVTELDVAVSR